MQHISGCIFFHFDAVRILKALAYKVLLLSIYIPSRIIYFLLSELDPIIYLRSNLLLCFKFFSEVNIDVHALMIFEVKTSLASV